MTRESSNRWWRVGLVSLMTVLGPSFALLGLRAWIMDGDVLDPGLYVFKIWLFVALPVSLFLEWRRLYRLRHSVAIWLMASIVSLAGYRLAVVLWDRHLGYVQSLWLELLVQNRPYFLGNGVVDAMLLIGAGVIVWAVVFWQPAQSRFDVVRRLCSGGSNVRAIAMRAATALIGSAIMALVAFETSIIFARSCL
jgi:hypothetical protein